MAGAMTPDDLKRWRTALGLSQKDAAHALGLKRRVIQYYEKGERDGDSIEIPLTVRLACYALAQGVKDYQGPAADVPVVAEIEPTPPAKPTKDKARKKAKDDKPAKAPVKTKAAKKAAKTVEPPAVTAVVELPIVEATTSEAPVAEEQVAKSE